MARTSNRKRGGKRKKAVTVGPNPSKKIEKKYAKKELALVPSTSTTIPLSPSNVGSNERKIEKQGKKKDKSNGERSSGFIFMCSGKTKPECYKYRVFGLPAGKMDVVENIKPGTKLFLFDFDLKLLYGVYKATSNGGYKLEPSAFGGRFPAQVRFKIFTDCLPLPESEFKHAIKENYQRGSKFAPELSSRQVRKLIGMFRPISFAPAAPLAPPPSHGRHSLPVMEDRFQPIARLPPPEDPHVAPPVRLPQHEDPYAVVPARLLLREDPYAVAPARRPPLEDPYGRAPPVALDPRHLQPVMSRHDPHYSVEARHAYLPENPPLPQDPYGRYREAPEIVQREPFPVRDSEYHRAFLERENGVVSHLDRPDDYYSQLPPRVASHTLPPPYAVVPAPAPVSYAPISSHAPLELPPHQTSSYISRMASEDPNRVYIDPHQRPASGGRISLAGGNLPVSLLYSFAGATPTYR